MKKLFYLPLFICLLTFSSCINIIEELFLEKDGTGVYTLTMDMSGIMENGGIRSLMQMGGEELQSEDNPFNGEEPVEVDTVMYMKDAPDSIRIAFGNDALLDKISIHQVVSESKELMTTKFTLNFDKIAEIAQFLNNLDKLQSSDNPMSGGGGALFPSGNGKLKLFSLNKRTLTRFPSPSSAEEMSEEEMGMMKMMLADATYTTIYHLPGKVQKTTMANAVVNEKTVTLEYPAMDAIEGKINLEGLIKFKKK